MLHVNIPLSAAHSEMTNTRKGREFVPDFGTTSNLNKNHLASDNLGNGLVNQLSEQL